MRELRIVLMGLAFFWGAAQAADLRGHGGPVRAIVIEGNRAATASFDTHVIRWDLARGTALEVLRFHDGAVNALASLPDGGLASASEDRRIAIWGREGNAPSRILEGHQGPIAALALSPDSGTLASASWDGTIRLWPLGGGPARIIEGHRGPVNAVAFLSNGTMVSAGYDGTLRIHAPGNGPNVIELGLPLNALLAVGDELVVAGADGALRFVDPVSGKVETTEITEFPIVALAASPDGGRIAAAGFRGALVIADRAKRAVARRFEGPAFPLWSLAFSLDGTEILTGGADRLVRRWKVATGEPVNPVVAEATEAKLKTLAHHPGAEVFRACIACHTLDADDGNRAGPSLHRIMGRKIATAPGYAFSPALGKLDIIWSRETVAKLFEIGPMAYTPGTKMPEQVITNAADREALVDFLEQATR